MRRIWHTLFGHPWVFTHYPTFAPQTSAEFQDTMISSEWVEGDCVCGKHIALAANEITKLT